jgi:RecA-family ATPase
VVRRGLGGGDRREPFRFLSFSELCALSLVAPQYISGNWLMTGVVSLLLGVPGVGKSLYAILMAVCAAAGIAVAGEWQAEAVPVLLINAEDAPPLTARRVRAAISLLGADLRLMERNLTVLEFRKSTVLITRGGRTRVESTQEGLRIFARAREMGVKLIVVDPFLETHDVEENSNEDMHAVLGTYRAVARDGNCAILVVHHIGKPDGTKVTLGSSRGASSVGGAIRAARAVSELDKSDIARLGISTSEARDYFKVDDLKLSYARRRQQPIYFRRESVLIDGIDTPQIVVVDPDAQEDEPAAA